LKSWLSPTQLRHQFFAPVILAVVILAVYYPALLSGVHPIDDPGIIAFYSASPSLSSIFLPGTGYYYRPLLEFTYYLDNRLWGMEPGIMHLENILLHVANSLLVYLLSRRIFAGYDNESRVFPLLAALLFALHPVNVEAVVWIAGRSDPLLSLFVLSALYYWLKWLEEPYWRDMAVALLLFAAALLTKETALAFGVVASLFALTWPGSATRRQRITAVVLLASAGVLLLFSAVAVRSGTSALSRFISVSEMQLLQGTWQVLIALGFYVRKLIVPLPLNSAITSVHPIYGLLGVALFPVLLLMYRRIRLSGVFFISAVFLILPAILVAVKPIAWTPFAERYLYLPTAFFVLGLLGIVETWKRKYSGALLIVVVLILCGAGLASFRRTLIWKDPLSFLQDAVAKSPDFGSLYYSLGGVLMQNGKIDQAATAFATADRLNQRGSMRYPIKASIMGALLAKGKPLEARTYFFQTFNKKQEAPEDFLELLYKADGKRLESLGKNERLLLAQDLLETLELLNQKKPDPFWFYRSGQISLHVGDTVRAVEFFRRAYSAAPIDAHYRLAARTYLEKLEHAK